MFTGLSAFPLTPLDDRGAVDAAAFQRLVGRLVEARVDSIGALGSTGSAAYLTREERARVSALAVEVAAGVPVMVGVGATRTEHVLALADDAQAAGAAALMLPPVSYQPLNDDEVLGLYTDVAAAVSVPLCVYDNPTTTGFAFADDLRVAIAGLPNVAAIKLPPADVEARIAALRPRVPAGVALGVSGDFAAVRARTAGADVWFSVVGGLLPELAQAIWRDGDDADAEPLWALFRRHGGARTTATAAVLLGLAGEHVLPRPLGLLQGDARDELTAALAPLTRQH